MKCLAITNKGIEETASLEIKEMIGSSSVIGESTIEFEIREPAELCQLCYKAQSVARLLILLCKFKVEKDIVSTIENLRKIILCCKFSPWVSNGASFKVECERVGEHSFTSPEAESEIGALISDKIKLELGEIPKVDMKNPDCTIYAYIRGGNGFLGIDFAGFDLSKRYYKVFGTTPTIKAPIAYAAVRMAGLKEKSRVLDPFSGSGIVMIEAAIFLSGFPVNFYRKREFAFLKLPSLSKMDFESFFAGIDAKARKKIPAKLVVVDKEMRTLSLSKKNAKIAGINKHLNFSRQDIEWLDTRFDEGSIDAAVTFLPGQSKGMQEAELLKLYNELFYQLEYILKKGGVVVVICHSKELFTKAAEKYKLQIAGETVVFGGEQRLEIVKLVKTSTSKIKKKVFK